VNLDSAIAQTALLDKANPMVDLGPVSVKSAVRIAAAADVAAAEGASPP
jgi:hypothetical protein